MKNLIDQNPFVEALFDGMDEAVILADTDRRMVRVNEAALEMFGYRRDELIGNQTAMLYAEASDFEKTGRERFNTASTIASGGTKYRVDYRRKDGSVLTSDTIATRVADPDGTVRGYVGIIRDVSVAARTEDVLRNLYTVSIDQSRTNEEKVQAMLEEGARFFSLPLGIVSHIHDETYIAEYIVGPPDAPAAGSCFALGETYCTHVISADRAVSFHHAGQSEIAGHPCYENFGLEAYIGVPLWVSGQRYGTLNFSGAEPRIEAFNEAEIGFIQLFAEWIAHQLAEIRNVSLIEGARLEAERLRRHAEAASTAKSRFLANMSHEIRTPLNGVLGMSQLLNRTALNPSQQRFVNSIQASGRTLLALIDDVLDLSRIEAGELALERDTTALHPILQDALETVRANAMKKSLDLRLDLDPSVSPQVNADRKRLLQVLVNLLGNAVKFTDAGSVTLRAAPGSAPPSVRFEVEDTGPGVSAAAKQKIFDRFQMANDTPAREHGGAGLGLSIVHELVTLLGGTLGVKDSKTGGALFWFEVPIASGAGERSAMIAPATTSPSSQGLRVLVVEDDQFSRDVICEFLRAANHQVLVADSGQNAISLARTTRCLDLILMDLHMPHLSGLRAMKRIKAISKRMREVPVVFVTADAAPQTHELLLAKGAAECLNKPIDLDTLSNVINSLTLKRAA